MMTRMPLPEVRFFAIVIGIQQQAGGNLSEALGNLSGVLRDRKRLQAKVSALSAEAKASAAVLGALPFVVMILVYITTPDYIMLLWTTQLRPVPARVRRGLDDRRHPRDAQDDQLQVLRLPQRSLASATKPRGCMAMLDQFISLLDPQFVVTLLAAICGVRDRADGADAGALARPAEHAACR